MRIVRFYFGDLLILSALLVDVLLDQTQGTDHSKQQLQNQLNENDKMIYNRLVPRIS